MDTQTNSRPPNRLQLFTHVMKRTTSIVFCVLIFVTASAQQAGKKSNTADQDREFDEGSGISDVPLNPVTIQNLAVLGKVWGYLKYYHPSVASGEYNWDYALFRILPRVIHAKSQDERNSVLTQWVKKLPEYEKTTTNLLANRDVKLTPDLAWIDAENLGPELATLLDDVKSGLRSDEHYYIATAPRVGNAEFRHENSYAHMSLPDAGFRLLSLYRYWNIIQYYFPYKNLIDDNWNDVLTEFIPRFVKANDELTYKLTCLALFAKINDSHATFRGNDRTMHSFNGTRMLPVEITFIENKATVTAYLNKQLGEETALKIGDVIESIDNQSIEEIIRERLPVTPASNYPTQLRDIANALIRTNSSKLNIQYSNGKVNQSTSISSFQPEAIGAAYFLRRDTCFKMIDPGIAYIYPGTIKNAYLPAIMEEVRSSKGLIIDFRCYPSDFILFTLSEYLLPQPTPFTRVSFGSIQAPGVFYLGNEITAGKENPDYFKGKVIIIVNEKTQSSAEFHAMAFRVAPNATVIGSTTAGADGNVSKFSLPGGISTAISGIGVYYPDGGETQRIGIVPDLEVRPTIQGIRDGRDEVLEVAIELINKP